MRKIKTSDVKVYFPLIISLVTLYISYKVSNASLIMISAFWEAVVYAFDEVSFLSHDLT